MEETDVVAGWVSKLRARLLGRAMATRVLPTLATPTHGGMRPITGSDMQRLEPPLQHLKELLQ